MCTLDHVLSVDMSDPKAIVSPGLCRLVLLACVRLTCNLKSSITLARSSFSTCLTTGGVGFDINCGVRLLRTNLEYKDVGKCAAFTLINRIRFGSLHPKARFLFVPCQMLYRAFAPAVLQSPCKNSWLNRYSITFQWVWAPRV